LAYFSLTSAEMSGHFGTSAEGHFGFGTHAEVSYGQFCTGAEVSWVQSVLGLNCPESEVSVFLN